MKKRMLKKEYEQFNQQMPLKIATLTNATFAYRYYQNPNPKLGVTLILLAGGSGLADAFFLLFPLLKEKYHLVTFPYPKDFNTNGKLADALAELIKQLDLEHIYLVGQSYGGLFAQVMAKHYPNLIKGMILSGTCSMSNDLNYDGIQNIITVFNPKKLEKNRRRYQFLPDKLLPIILKLAFKKVSVKQKSPYDLTEVVDLLKDSINTDYWYHMDLLLGDLTNEFGTHKAADFTSYQNEVMLIFSKEDTIFCDNVKKALIRLMPDSTLVHNLEGGHLALIVNPDIYIQKIDDFLSERNE